MPKDKRKRNPITIRLDPFLHEQIQQLSGQNIGSVNRQVKELLICGLKHHTLLKMDHPMPAEAKNKRQSISVRLDQTLYQEIDQLSKAEIRNLNSMITVLLITGLKHRNPPQTTQTS